MKVAYKKFFLILILLLSLIFIKQTLILAQSSNSDEPKAEIETEVIEGTDVGEEAFEPTATPIPTPTPTPTPIKIFPSFTSAIPTLLLFLLVVGALIYILIVKLTTKRYKVSPLKELVESQETDTK